jgi:hypothetical protein
MNPEDLAEMFRYHREVGRTRGSRPGAWGCTAGLSRPFSASTNRFGPGSGEWREYVHRRQCGQLPARDHQ